MGGVQLHIVAMWKFVSSVIRALDIPSRGVNLDLYIKYFNFKCSDLFECIANVLAEVNIDWMDLWFLTPVRGERGHVRS